MSCGRVGVEAATRNAPAPPQSRAGINANAPRWRPLAPPGGFAASGYTPQTPRGGAVPRSTPRVRSARRPRLDCLRTPAAPRFALARKASLAPPLSMRTPCNARNATRKRNAPAPPRKLRPPTSHYITHCLRRAPRPALTRLDNTVRADAHHTPRQRAQAHRFALSPLRSEDFENLRHISRQQEPVTKSAMLTRGALSLRSVASARATRLHAPQTPRSAILRGLAPRALAIWTPTNILKQLRTVRKYAGYVATGVATLPNSQNQTFLIYCRLFKLQNWCPRRESNPHVFSDKGF